MKRRKEEKREEMKGRKNEEGKKGGGTFSGLRLKAQEFSFILMTEHERSKVTPGSYLGCNGVDNF